MGDLAGGLDYVIVSGAFRRFEERREKNKDFAALFQKAKSQLEIGKI
jgi:hypothetical protein